MGFSDWLLANDIRENAEIEIYLEWQMSLHCHSGLDITGNTSSLDGVQNKQWKSGLIAWKCKIGQSQTHLIIQISEFEILLTHATLLIELELKMIESKGLGSDQACLGWSVACSRIWSLEYANSMVDNGHD